MKVGKGDGKLAKKDENAAEWKRRLLHNMKIVMMTTDNELDEKNAFT
jgi:hypothetical protein